MCLKDSVLEAILGLSGLTRVIVLTSGNERNAVRDNEMGNRSVSCLPSACMVVILIVLVLLSINILGLPSCVVDWRVNRFHAKLNARAQFLERLLPVLEEHGITDSSDAAGVEDLLNIAATQQGNPYKRAYGAVKVGAHIYVYEKHQADPQDVIWVYQLSSHSRFRMDGQDPLAPTILMFFPKEKESAATSPKEGE